MNLVGANRDRGSGHRMVRTSTPVLWIMAVLALLAMSVPALAAPPGTVAYVESAFDVIAHGHDTNVGDFTVFLNAEEVSDGWNIQIRADGAIVCYWEGVAGDHFTETTGELGVQTDSPDSSGDCDGAFMHVFAVAEFTLTGSQSVSSVRDNGQHCIGTRGEAHYFEATVVVTHDAFAAPVEIVTTDTHYSTVVDGFCHSVGTPGSPND